MKILKTLLIVGSVTIIMLIMVFIVRDYCYITRKHRSFAHRDCNANLNIKSQNSCRISQPKKL